jgi:hypothetical protein
LAESFAELIERLQEAVLREGDLVNPAWVFSSYVSEDLPDASLELRRELTVAVVEGLIERGMVAADADDLAWLHGGAGLGGDIDDERWLPLTPRADEVRRGAVDQLIARTGLGGEPLVCLVCERCALGGGVWVGELVGGSGVTRSLEEVLHVVERLLRSGLFEALEHTTNRVWSLPPWAPGVDEALARLRATWDKQLRPEWGRCLLRASEGVVESLRLLPER